MERCRLVFSGSGGQGVITAAIILAEAAVLYENLIAVQSQKEDLEQNYSKLQFENSVLQDRNTKLNERVTAVPDGADAPGAAGATPRSGRSTH